MNRYLKFINDRKKTFPIAIKRIFKNHYFRLKGNKQYELTYSSEYNYTWFRVAKAGTSSISAVLLDKTNPNLHGYDIPYRKEDYKDSFKFCFIRNPWDRIVSCYSDKVFKKQLFPECWDRDFEYFVDYLSNQDLDVANNHIRRQSACFPINDIDHIALFENFKEEYNYIINQKFQLNVPLVHKNKSKRNNYSEYYNERTKKIIGKLYAEDVKLGQYQF